MASRDDERAVNEATINTQEQSGVETPEEIASPKAVTKATRSERADAMAAENAQTNAPVVGKERDERERRAAQMADENAATFSSQDDDERDERAKRADMMARENAATAASIQD
jgi:hypothetical protein